MIGYARDIGTLLRGNGRAVGVALTLSAVSAAVDMLCMVLLPVFLLTALTGPAAASTHFPMAALLGRLAPSYATLAVLVIAAFLLRGALTLYLGSRLAHLSETVRANLIARLTRHYLTCPYQAFTGRSVSWAMTMVGPYAATFTVSVVLPLMRLVLDLLTVAAILGFLLLVDHRIVGVTALVLGGIGIAYYLAVRRASERQSRRLTELQASFNQHVSRSLHSPREVRIFQLQHHFLGSIQDDLARGAEAQARLTLVAHLPRVLGEFTLIGLALGYLVYRTHAGSNTAVMMSQMGLLAFAGLRLLSSFAQSLGNVSALKAGRHVTRLLVQELASIGPTPQAVAELAPSHAPFTSLELRRIAFDYAPDAPVLRDITLKIGRGDSVGIVGASGAGKSTLGDVLLGLLRPTAGEILLNGRPAALDTAAWWGTVGLVPQTVFLTNDTLLRNIAFGIPDAAIDRAKAARVASMAQLDEVIRQMPQGLDGLVGDYGVRLSGGQRQRVAIARALYREREFLVLDEATSSLDAETEKAIVEAVDSLRGAITTFIIAHRRSTLAGCNVVLELRHGRLHAIEPGERHDRPPAA